MQPVAYKSLITTYARNFNFLRETRPRTLQTRDIYGSSLFVDSVYKTAFTACLVSSYNDSVQTCRAVCTQDWLPKALLLDHIMLYSFIPACYAETDMHKTANFPSSRSLQLAGWHSIFVSVDDHFGRRTFQKILLKLIMRQ